MGKPVRAGRLCSVGGFAVLSVWLAFVPGAAALNAHASSQAVCPGAAVDNARCSAHVVTDRNGNPSATTAPTGYGPTQTESSREEDGVHLPLKELGAGAIRGASWHDSERFSFLGVELLAISKVRPETRTHPQ
jgi:hypothetical protein